MIELYLLRHAEAAPQASFQDDASRQLTVAGKAQAAKLAQHLKKMGLTFDVVISSPFDRAKQTAQIILEATSSSHELTLSSSLTPNASTREILKELKPLHRCKRILLVGHMPHLGQLASFLISGLLDAHVMFEKSAMARINFQNSAGIGSLVWLLSPDQIA
jgi:phosphohistidine phosphatase